MSAEEDHREEQKRVSIKGAKWIARNLVPKLMFGIRSDGTKDLTIRLEKDGEEFPLEWFRVFRIILWLMNGTAIECEVDEVREIKWKWFYFSLAPSSDRDQELWADLRDGNIDRIELVVDDQKLIFAWYEDLQLFLLQEMN